MDYHSNGVSIESFETGDIDAAKFDHDAHIYVAWKYLQENSLGQSGDRFTAALKRFTASVGESEKYHETISWFFMIVIAGRAKKEQALNWDKFKASNQDLFDSKAFLSRHYSKALLNSDEAKTSFVLPDMVSSSEGS